MANWINVKDKLPEDDLPKNSERVEIRVLACEAGKPASVKKLSRIKYHKYNKATNAYDGPEYWEWSRDIRNVTHWMYLPAPPPKEKET